MVVVVAGMVLVPRGGGGGALRYHIDTHCQTTAWSESDEGQTLGAVNSFWERKG